MKKMAVDQSAYYNYYHIKSYDSPNTPQVPEWKKKYAVTTDEIRSNNFSREDDAYEAYSKLEDIYYSVAVRNRQNYSNVIDLYAYLSQKYLFHSDYNGYRYEEKQAMYFNELEMTLYGCLNGGGNVNDPRLTKDVCDPSDTTIQSYNRKMVNIQLQNVLANNGIKLSALYNSKLVFAIDLFHYRLTVYGAEDEKMANQIEQALNRGKNAKQLFYHILNSRINSIPKEIITKYRAIKGFQKVTGLDLRDFIVTEVGFVNLEGKNALEIYREFLKETDSIPNDSKRAAYSYFSEQLQKLAKINFSNIMDLNLEIGYEANKLTLLSDEWIVTNRFHA